ncbi:phosphoribosylformylglycinamidine synthase subunit PurS [Actinotalea sp.]|uniref:phosphoribosylformylglycinamidine synthase subunit PurS n=1 Tax=Actinotalea sp. TaxID=1872145 RepID=UPI002C191134|nr:phosphoribosylformylglycinamidine synthase subunit PurS [Actinotalea sp.]HQY34206.1 phosphoribosylformylglycinamidine synthase subunit PurS [Actinotalea sp.]HRA50930.1 phosphoribosylformylglycinamidine synthase subunit PurS [Actinotalea sp.]
MGTVVVDVMPKPEILDPQGKAVAAALPRLGFTGFTGVRQGRRFELTVDGEVTEEVLEQVREAAATLLSNPVIEDVVRVEAVAEPAAADA